MDDSFRTVIFWISVILFILAIWRHTYRLEFALTGILLIIVIVIDVFLENFD